MPALASKNSGKYVHIYNEGIDNKNLFNDSEDIQVFSKYLKEYLDAPPDLNEVKKTFSINGRTFQGVPHQPRNYYNKIELIAYSLLPEHFHLIVKEISPNSVQKFIRSISTRYVIYYNKKYQRKGSLFQGPYKSVKLNDLYSLLLLTQHIHKEYINSSVNHVGSTHEEYLKGQNPDWIKSHYILSLFEDKVDPRLNKYGNYKNFIENYQPEGKEGEMLDKLIIEKDYAKTSLTNDRSKATQKLETKGETITNPDNNQVEENKNDLSTQTTSEDNIKEQNKHRRSLFVYALTTSMVFVFLFSLGLKNVITTTKEPVETIAELPPKSPSPTPREVVLEASTKEDNFLEETTNKLVIIRTSSEMQSTNIFREKSIDSYVISEASNGDVFDYLSENSEWYKVRLDNGEVGFVMKSSAVIQEGGTN